MTPDDGGVSANADVEKNISDAIAINKAFMSDSSFFY
jgi:hypothetical protein